MRRSFVSLMTAMTFLVIAVTGVLAFVRPFSMTIVGLHALMGFLFIGVVGFHLANNLRPLKRYLRSKWMWINLAVTAALTTAIALQPQPVKALLGLSGNLGPALDRFELHDEGLTYQYTPAPHYKLTLSVRMGDAFDPADPPEFAIWIENSSFYHIKTLHRPEAADNEASLPYWSFKVKEYEKAKLAAAAGVDVDAISGATKNSSFDPADYMLPVDPEEPMPYRILVEINQPGDASEAVDDQPSLIYSVEVDNSDPHAFQLLDLIGYPQLEEDEQPPQWAIYYVDQRFDSALALIDSALLTIDRDKPAD